MKNRYEIIEHTADVGLRSYGNSLSTCFEYAAKGMFDLITASSIIEDRGEYGIKLKADDLDQLLVDFLDELLFLHSSRNLVFGFFKVSIDIDQCYLSAIVKGDEFDLSKHQYGIEIKAVTYHMLEVKKNKPYSVQVLFDI
jgi:SHS2 domain-containing protein